MSKIFMFGDGSPDGSSQWDTRTGQISSGWTKSDFVVAINVHQKAFGSHYTHDVLYRLFNTTDATRVPSYAYGKIIAALTEEMASHRTSNIKRAPLYDGKKDMA